MMLTIAMTSALIPFWQLRQHGTVEEAVRGQYRRRPGAWTLSAVLTERLRPLLEPHGFDLTREIQVEEVADENGFRFSQGAPGLQ